MKENKLILGIVQMAMKDSLDDNVSSAEDGIKKAAAQGAQIVCLPELFAWTYFPSSRGAVAEAVTVPGRMTERLSKSAKQNGIVLVGGSLYEADGGRNFNTCLVFDETGKTVSKYRKVHIPQDEHYYEKDYFSPGNAYHVAKTRLANVGSLICFDQWYSEPARIEKLLGAQVLFYPTAIGWVDGIEPDEGDWKKAWEGVQVGHAIANSFVVCAVNRVGKEGGTRFWGGSFVSDQFGKVLFRAGEEEGVFVVPCELSLGARVEEGWGFMRNRMKATYGKITR